MSKPITSRIKRSPLLKYSPLKNDEEEKNKIATGSKTEKGKDETVTEIVKTPKKSLQEAYKDRGSEYKDLSFEEYSKVAKADPLYGTSGGEKEITTTKKGEDKTYDVKLKTTQEQDVLQPWEVRQQLRAGKRADREVNKYRRKMSKYGTFNKEGKFTPKEGLSQKELRKLDQAQGAYGRATNVSARVDEGAGSGYRAGERIKRKEDRFVTTGEQEKPEQIAQGVKEQKKREQIAEQAGLTVDQAPKAIEAGPNPFANMDAAKGLTTLDYEVGQYYTPFNSKKSPLSKALKGDQYKLPQHLQQAIKAAPGKLKTPLKKGYFKNK
jgi:hypothetical protein